MNNLKKVQSVHRYEIIPFVSLSVLNGGLSQGQINNYKIYSPAEAGEKLLVIKKNEFYITTQLYRLLSYNKDVLFIDCEVLEKYHVIEMLRKKITGFTLLDEEFYSQVVIAKLLIEEINLTLEEICILLGVSITTGYKMRTLFGASLVVLGWLQYNVMPIDFAVDLYKNFNDELVLKAIEWSELNKTSPFEVYTYLAELNEENRT